MPHRELNLGSSLPEVSHSAAKREETEHASKGKCTHDGGEGQNVWGAGLICDSGPETVSQGYHKLAGSRRAREVAWNWNEGDALEILPGPQT